ncbi:MAG: DEAD/DEAH box helicase [Litorimonas sp.]
MSSKDALNEIPADAPVDITFSELGLDRRILKALDDIGYETPTPIQAQAIPAAMMNRDVLGIAQTGTGKTGAFTLPTMNKLATGRARARMPRCLIVCPTRELAAQVAEDVQAYGKYLKLEMALLIGGVSFGEQDRKLTKGVDILIATPGRLLDQFERGKILMTGVQTLVVDEADRMLDMGFIPDIERIFEITPFTRQVLFFSATMPPEIKRLVDQFLHQPKTVQIARRNSTAKTVRQRIARVPSSDGKLKRTALRHLIDQEEVDSGIIFSNRKKDVDIIAKSLTKYGYNAEPIHGDLPQSVRTKTLERFKEGYIKFLVASDVAARGLDVSTITHVFNYDVPFHSEDYIHRIGRTGRAGRKGDAIMLVAPLDEKNYDAILDLTGKDAIEEIDIPGVDDMPREGRGGSRGRGGNTSGGRGSSRRSSSSSSRRSSSAEKSARSDKDTSAPTSRRNKPVERENPPEEVPVESRPKPTRSRRKAPSRASSDTEANDTTPAETETKRKTEAKTESREPSRSRSSRSSDDKPSRSRSDSKSSRSKSSSRGSSKSGQTGFAGDMPAFFER